MSPFRFPLRKVSLPDRRALGPYIDRIDASGIYSNYGPLELDFEADLAKHFGCAPSELVVLANATIALTLGLNFLNARPGAKCLVPSLTFLASPASILAAGLTPYFMDIDRETATSSPALAEQALAEAGGPSEVAAVMPVSTYGAPTDIEAWKAFEDRTGVKVIVDAAWCFDNARVARLPQCISLHATKVFGSAEGGVFICSDTDMVTHVRKRANFGILPDRRVLIPGINGKMSEYHAAVGLAGLKQWPERRAKTLELQGWYLEALAKAPGLRIMPGQDNSWAGGTIAVIFENPAADIATALAGKGIEARHWWGRPCHLQPAYEPFEKADLSCTKWICERILNLPFWFGMSQSDVAYITEAIRAAAR
jgi:dTDP-4-amino-4,6-dideoxygalactose transaminase